MHLKRLIVLLVLLALSSSLHAQRFNQKREYDGLRDGAWEASLLVGSQSSLDVAGQQGSVAAIDSAVGWGLTLGWNMTPKWHFSYRLIWSKPDYSATIVPEDPEQPPRTLDYSLDRYAHQFNATYHFFRGPLTPYVQAGVGYGTVDSNIPSTPPQTGCWWDPWWGYICETNWDTYDAGEFTYNVGLGLRWDINGALFVRGSYHREFLSADRADFDFDLLSLEVGLMW